MTNFEKVGVFMKTFNQDVKDSSSLSTDKINSLRISLINEELEELKQAISEKNLIEVADALTDILYVTYGAGHAFGINLDKCFEEVQKSNMSKLGKDGKPIYIMNLEKLWKDQTISNQIYQNLLNNLYPIRS